MSSKSTKKIIEQEVLEPIVTPKRKNSTINLDAITKDDEVNSDSDKETLNKKKFGVVIGCENLNIRSEANTNSKIVSVIKVDSEVSIDDKGSTEKFYKVCTSSGVEGYCMRQYISIL